MWLLVNVAGQFHDVRSTQIISKNSNTTVLQTTRNITDPSSKKYKYKTISSKIKILCIKYSLCRMVLYCWLLDVVNLEQVEIIEMVIHYTYKVIHSSLRQKKSEVFINKHKTKTTLIIHFPERSPVQVVVAVCKDVELWHPETEKRSKQNQTRQHQVEMSPDQAASQQSGQ